MRIRSNIFGSFARFAALGAFSVLILLAVSVPASAQRRKKAPPASSPRTVEIVSEANTPESPKPVAKPVVEPVTSGPAGGYRGSLQDLVTLRESELSEATVQHEKMVELGRDGLVSQKAVQEAADAIVEARAKLADAKMRLASFDGTPMTTEPDPYADVTDTTTDLAADHASAPAANTPQPALKKTSIIYPRRKSPSRTKKP